MATPAGESLLPDGRLIRAMPGPPLGMEASRRRPMGRIGGGAGPLPDDARLRLAEALGPDGQVLWADGRGASAVVDSDCQGDCGPPSPGAPWGACPGPRTNGYVSSDVGGAARARSGVATPRTASGGTGVPEDRATQASSEAVATTSGLQEGSGGFAAAWTDGEGLISLSRDAVGERSLYYAAVDRGFLFSSTIQGLLATGLVSRSLDPVALAAYLTYAYVPGERTLLRDVRKLLPGERLDFGFEGVRRSVFWRVPEEPETFDGEEVLRVRLREVLERAVRRRLPPAGERVGAFLSGGLDSSLVVALARRLHDGPVSTFSVSFGDGYANELPFSSLVARHCRTDHRVVELSPEVVRRHLDESIAFLGDPIGDPLTVPNALLFREAAAETGVVLNGEGGDPCFGGPKNLPMLLAELLGEGGGYYDASGDHAGEDRRGHFDADGDHAGNNRREHHHPDHHRRERSYLRAHQKCFDDLPLLLSEALHPAALSECLEDEVASQFGDGRHRTFVTKLMALNVVLKGAHHILPKVDALSAPFGVLARSPLFDREVVEMAFAIPPQLKLRGSVEKHLLKEAVRDLLPAAIVQRPKSGMLVPVEGWFQGPLLPEARERILDGLAPWRLFRPEFLERLLRGKLQGHRPRRGVKIWLLVTLESWLRSVVGRP